MREELRRFGGASGEGRAVSCSGIATAEASELVLLAGLLIVQGTRCRTDPSAMLSGDQWTAGIEACRSGVGRIEGIGSVEGDMQR